MGSNSLRRYGLEIVEERSQREATRDESGRRVTSIFVNKRIGNAAANFVLIHNRYPITNFL